MSNVFSSDFRLSFSNYLPEVVIKGFSTRGRGSAAALKPPTDEANRMRAGVLAQIPVFHVDALKPIKPSRSRFNVVGDRDHHQATYQNRTM